MSSTTVHTGRFIAFSKPFIDGIKNIFETMVFTTITPTKPQIKGDQVMLGDVSVAIGLNGKITINQEVLPFKGMLVLSFPYSTYVKIASSMLMAEYTEFCEDIKDVGAEISNITTGSAKKYLREMGYLIDMSIPSTVIGENHKIQYPAKTQVVVIPFEGTCGKFFMELCYQDFPEANSST
jgi:chemotaxis protein CheX